METLTADSERVLGALVGTGNVTVQRNCDLQLELAHAKPPVVPLLLTWWLRLDERPDVIGDLDDVVASVDEPGGSLIIYCGRSPDTGACRR